MKKLLLIPALCVMLHFSSSAQVRFGINAGVAVTNFAIKVDDITSNTKSKTGFAGGVVIDIPMSKSFSFQPGVNYIQKGSKEEETDGETTFTSSFKVNSLEVPLNFIFNTNAGSGGLFVGGGPSYTYHMSGSLEVTDGTESLSEKLKLGSTADDNLRTIDVGANFLAGYRFANGLFLTANYNLGLTNLTPVTTDGSTKSHYFGVKLGFLFGGSGKK